MMAPQRDFPAAVTQSDLWHGTTILTVRKGGLVAIGGDGQVTIGQTIVKANGKKVRHWARRVTGLRSHCRRSLCSSGSKPSSTSTRANSRAPPSARQDWRTDRYLRRLEAMMIVADAAVSLFAPATCSSEVGAMGIGSGGNYALAATRALIDGPLDVEAIVRRSLDISADICVHEPTSRSRRCGRDACQPQRTTEHHPHRLSVSPGLAADLPLIEAQAALSHVREWWAIRARDLRGAHRRSAPASS